jgi:hypothetical protein
MPLFYMKDSERWFEISFFSTNQPKFAQRKAPRSWQKAITSLVAMQEVGHSANAGDRTAT